MQLGLVHLHNLLRWVILILLITAIVKTYIGSKKNNGVLLSADKKIGLFTLISSHITLLIGIYQLLLGRFGILVTELPAGESFMKNRFFRFYWMEHPLLTILAVVCITAAYSQLKKNKPDVQKYAVAFKLYLVALALLLLAIPWPFRADIGRAILPGMH